MRPKPTGEQHSASKPVTKRVRRWLINNPLAGLAAPLGGAPRSTWALVPAFVVVAMAVGFGRGHFALHWPDPWRALLLPIVLVFFPTLVEEVFHRGVLLPRSLLVASRARRFMAATASTAVYVSFHPVSPLLGLSEADVFLDPFMLGVVAALGYATAYAYLRSGSLRAPMLIHWATVVVWNLFLGGVYSGTA